MVEELNEQTFGETVSEGLHLVDFWAPWCGPCRIQGPIIDELAEEMDDVSFVKVNIDENPNLAQEFQIMSIPTMMIIKDGVAKDVIVGVHQKQQLLDLLNQYR